MTLAGEAVEPTVSGNYLIIKVQNIPTRQLADTFPLTVDEKTFDVSVIQYMYNMVTNKPGTPICDLCKALYAYYLAANQL